MSHKIESDKLLVQDIFRKWYKIPEYQRPYVWETDQVTELLEDVMSAHVSNSDSQYFLGSMVLRKKEVEENGTRYIEYDLLDGQQRLTTLFLIYAVVRDLTPIEYRINACKEAIFQIANPDYNIPERLRIIFDIRDTVKEFIQKYVKESGGTQKTNDLEELYKSSDDLNIKNMSKAILTINEFFKNNKIDDFFPYLTSNVLMIYVSAEELEDAFRLFTVLNSRGVKLRNSDILKAQNLGATNEQDRIRWAKKWESTENYFGEDFDNFLSHLRTILVKQKASVSLLKEFEDNIYNPKSFDRNSKKYTNLPPLLEKGEKTFEFINTYKEHYEKLFEKTIIISSGIELYNYLQLMQKGFEADFWIAPLLRFYDKFKTEQLLEFVKKLDNKFANDWLLGYTPTTRIENINKVIQLIDDSNIPADVINHSLLEINKKDLIEALSGDIYGRRAARYIMLRLDLIYHGHTTEFDIPETISIEHILPQTPNDDSQWIKDFTEDDRLDWTNKIGNLVLISRRKNSSQGNKDYSDKREKYFKQNIELFSNSVRILKEYPTWNKNDLIKNHIEVLSKIENSL